MAKLKPGKRERMLLRLAEQSVNPKRQKPSAHVQRDPNYLRQRGMDGVTALMSKGATRFHGQGAAYHIREVARIGVRLGEVDKGAGFRALAPLPELDRDTLLTLQRGDKLAPTGERQNTVRTYATSPTVKRFSKTK